MSNLDTRFLGKLNARQYAVLFYDEIVTMKCYDPDPWIRPDVLRDAQEVYDHITNWPDADRVIHYSWLAGKSD